MNNWFRFYESALDDPKVQLLPGEVFKFWVNCLCLACRNDGYLPPISSVPFAFRMSESQAAEYIKILRSSGLLDEHRGRLSPHNWHKRQYKSDTSTRRVQRYRKRSIAVTGTPSVTPPDTDTEQIQIQRQRQNRTDTETETEGNSELALGEHGHARMTKSERDKLQAKLNGNFEYFIARFDNWVHEAPDAKKDGVRRRDRNAYASINSWFDREVKEGKLSGTHQGHGKQNPGPARSGTGTRVGLPYTPKQR